ncbi:conserved hypothetical protein [Ricinus communis]|uniref:Uncharacterized protein n=1 Tax=Ricinus communis TaxID=3988 RepID=B9S123_RICCO|nr:conserved hypothetical protein [Ricinus communis]
MALFIHTGKLVRGTSYATSAPFKDRNESRKNMKGNFPYCLNKKGKRAMEERRGFAIVNVLRESQEKQSKEDGSDSGINASTSTWCDGGGGNGGGGRPVTKYVEA